MTRKDVLLPALRSTPGELRLLTQRVTDAAALWRPELSAWCMLDVVCHLPFIEKLFRQRLQRVISEDEPHVPLIHPDEASHDLRRSLAAVIEDFATSRDETVRFLESLSPGDWQRTAIHERKGRMSFRYLVQDLVNHDIDHMNQLATLLRRYPSETDGGG